MKRPLLQVILLILALCQCVTARTVTAEKDGIVLEVTLAKEEEKTRVNCVLTNRTEFPLCTASGGFPVFRARLTDAAGNVLAQNSEWTEKFTRKSTPGFHPSKLSLFLEVSPGTSDTFTFQLEDAYPVGSLAQGARLEILWESVFFRGRADMRGKPYQFPPDWQTSVSILLGENEADAAAVRKPDGGNTGKPVEPPARTSDASAPPWRTVTMKKDGFVFEMKITKDAGKSQVSCVLTNHSGFPLRTFTPNESHAFYAKLMDAAGEEMLPNKQWAEDYGQKSADTAGWRRLKHEYFLMPGESSGWKFHLEDAYPADSIGKAENLEVSWECLDFRKWVDLEGNAYRFPRDWHITGTISLAKEDPARTAESGPRGKSTGGAGDSSVESADATGDLMRTRKAEKNGIVLEVTLAKEAGENRVRCVLENHSEFTICASNTGYNRGFYVRMADGSNKEMLPKQGWSEKWDQRLSRSYQVGSARAVLEVKPGESLDWEFFMEDAYLKSSLEQAAKLEISWETSYWGTTNFVDGSPYHFPENWKTSLELPLADMDLLPVSKAGSSEAEYDMVDINRRIASIKEKRLHLVGTSIAEQDLFKSEEFLSLQTKCSSDLTQIIANIEKVAGGDESKKLVVYGFSQVSAKGYMTVIESLVSKYENGTVSEELIREVLYPLGRMRAFARDNFYHGRMTGALNRVKAKSSDEVFKNGLEAILTGEAKIKLDDFREAHYGMPEGKIPEILIPK